MLGSSICESSETAEGEKNVEPLHQEVFEELG